MSTWIRPAPCKSCMIMPEVTIGEIPYSISVPRFEARITRIQKSGSDVSDDIIPYSGICEQIKKMKRVIKVHMTFSWNCTYRFAPATLTPISIIILSTKTSKRKELLFGLGA